MNSDKDGTLKNVTSALIGTIHALYRLSPFFVVCFLAIIYYLILGIAQTDFYTIFAIAIIVIVAIFIYIKSNNFGEASLSLAAGMLSVFSIKWEKSLFIAFSVTWVCFSMFSILVTSIRIAAKVEDITRRTALRINMTNYKEVTKRLELIRKNCKLIDPVEACSVQLLLAYYNIPMEVFPDAMEKIQELEVITDLNYKICTIFIIDIWQMAKNIPAFLLYFNCLFQFLIEASFPPEDVFNLVKSTKYNVISGKYAFTDYIKTMREKMNNTSSIEDIKESL